MTNKELLIVFKSGNTHAVLPDIKENLVSYDNNTIYENVLPYEFYRKGEHDVFSNETRKYANRHNRT